MESLIAELKKLGPIQIIVLLIELFTGNLIGALCWLIIFIMWND